MTSIKIRRLALGLTRPEVADICRLGTDRLALIENGHASATAEELLRLGRVLGCTVADLVSARSVTLPVTPVRVTAPPRPATAAPGARSR